MKDKKIILTVGVSCSGKSTWATSFIKDNPSYRIVSRDNIRESLFGKDYQQNNKDEEIVSVVFKETAHALLKNYNLVFDNTHLKVKYINAIIEEFNYLADIQLKVFDSSIIPYKELCERNTKRQKEIGKFIPWKVLDNQLVQFNSLNFNLITGAEGFTFNKPLSDIDLIVYKSKWKFNQIFDESLPYVYIFDIDGTLNSSIHRSPYSTEDEEILLDEPILPVTKVLKALKSDHKIIFVSGREDKTRSGTIRWLAREANCNTLPWGLFMRATGDHRPDYIVKKEIYEANIKDKYNVLGVFDDRSQVIENCWNRLGLFVFDVGQNRGRF